MLRQMPTWCLRSTGVSPGGILGARDGDNGTRSLFRNRSRRNLDAPPEPVYFNGESFGNECFDIGVSIPGRDAEPESEHFLVAVAGIPRP